MRAAHLLLLLVVWCAIVLPGLAVLYTAWEQCCTLPRSPVPLLAMSAPWLRTPAVGALMSCCSIVSLGLSAVLVSMATTDNTHTSHAWLYYTRAVASVARECPAVISPAGLNCQGDTWLATRDDSLSLFFSLSLSETSSCGSGHSTKMLRSCDTTMNIVVRESWLLSLPRCLLL